MHRFRLAIFDFDGTLADTFPFFAEVFNALARRHGFHTVAAHEVESLRRMHPREIMRHVAMPAMKLPIVAKDFIGLMRQRRHTIPLFPGVPELLSKLAQAGIEIGIVSSNARDNVIAILGESAAATVKHYACGTSIFGKRSHLRKLLKQTRIDRASALSIGDQASDLEAAHDESITFGAVAWGFGAIDHLHQAGADYAFCRLDDIAKLLAPGTASSVAFANAH